MQSDVRMINGSQLRPGGAAPPKTIPGPPAKFLNLLSFLAFGSPRDLLSFYIDAARQYG